MYFHSLGCVPQSGFSRSHVAVQSFEELPGCSLSGCTILHSCQQWMRVPISLQPHHHLLLCLPFFFFLRCLFIWASLVAQTVKNLPASVGYPGSIPGSGRSPGEGMATHSSILAWRTPWTEGPGGLRSMGSQSQTRLRVFGCSGS